MPWRQAKPPPLFALWNFKSSKTCKNMHIFFNLDHLFMVFFILFNFSISIFHIQYNGTFLLVNKFAYIPWSLFSFSASFTSQDWWASLLRTDGPPLKITQTSCWLDLRGPKMWNNENKRKKIWCRCLDLNHGPPGCQADAKTTVRITQNW